MGNPRSIRKKFAKYRTETEVTLASADRVDVVYYGPNITVVLEVKSIDSNDEDIRRGVFQCVKYRAVMEAMQKNTNTPVEAFLVTQKKLPSDLNTIAKLNNIRCVVAPECLQDE